MINLVIFLTRDFFSESSVELDPSISTSSFIRQKHIVETDNHFCSFTILFVKRGDTNFPQLEIRTETTRACEGG